MTQVRTPCLDKPARHAWAACGSWRPLAANRMRAPQSGSLPTAEAMTGKHCHSTPKGFFACSILDVLGAFVESPCSCGRIASSTIRAPCCRRSRAAVSRCTSRMIASRSNSGRKLDRAAQPGQVGDARAHVFEILVVGFGVALKDDLQLRDRPRRSRCLASCRIVIGWSLPMLNTPATAAVGLHQLHHRATTSLHVGEAAHLLAVVVHHQRPAGQRGFDESRQHHAVAARLPRADDVEEPADDHRQPVLPPIGQAPGTRRSPSTRRTTSAAAMVGPNTRSSSSVHSGLGFLPYTSLELARNSLTA